MKYHIIVENVSKKYSRNANQHLNYGFKDLLSEIWGSPRSVELRKDEFLAVNDVSFELEQGDSVGLIGRNGCGKTTLLKMINGIIRPDAGRICVDGRVQALISLGAGFNPDLSGRENIYTSASLMGLGKKETDLIVDEIIDFSELEEFIDSPVKTYSSGMYSRLGFSVAISLQPEILLIDEILAVGDHLFRNKCFIKMYELKKRGITIVLVSHSHTQVMQLCDKAIWMDKGTCQAIGKSKDVIDKYLEFLDHKTILESKKLPNSKKQKDASPKETKVKKDLYGPIINALSNINNIKVQMIVDGNESSSIPVGNSFKIIFGFDLLKKVRGLNVSLVIYRKDGLHLTAMSTLNSEVLKEKEEGTILCEANVKQMVLAPGEYVLVMPVHEGHSYLYRDVVKEFVVTKSRKITFIWGLCSLDYEYSRKDSEG